MTQIATSPLQPATPPDADQRRQARPVVCYELPADYGHDSEFVAAWRDSLELTESVLVPPRDARCFKVPAGHAFRIVSVDGPQVGDLNLWHATNLDERFFSGKTRQLHATHLTRGDSLWSCLPWLRPMASITYDDLEWYGWDADGAGVHDVIGTRCDPYTHNLIHGGENHHHCHSNLTRALVSATGLSVDVAEARVHDVLNVFMCTGFTRDTQQYFMKASPVRPGNYIEFMAEIPLLGALSACPGGDCGSTFSNDDPICYPLRVDILAPSSSSLRAFTEARANPYSRDHGLSSAHGSRS